ERAELARQSLTIFRRDTGLLAVPIHGPMAAAARLRNRRLLGSNLRHPRRARPGSDRPSRPRSVRRLSNRNLLRLGALLPPRNPQDVGRGARLLQLRRPTRRQPPVTGRRPMAAPPHEKRSLGRGPKRRTRQQLIERKNGRSATKREP